MAVIIHENGTLTTITGELTLAMMHAAVGGYIEPVRLAIHGAEETTLIVNEEGALRGMTHNPLASRLAGQSLVGPALLCTVRHAGTEKESWS